MLLKVGKYVVLIIAAGLIAYNSVYIKKLSELRSAEVKPFNAKEYARDYLYKKLPSSAGKAIEINELLAQLETNPLSAFSKYSHSLSEGDSKYFLVSGTGTIAEISDEYIFLKSKTAANVKIATEYIVGNTARDASGLISMDEFGNSMDINTVSEEINKLIKTEIIPPVKAKAKKGDLIAFKGCIELSKSDVKLDNIEIIPVFLTIKN
ncbi:MAG: DUF2291 domain-containing protein [Sphingobacteriaceae bacterium]|nr:DUF2291 domain-containing protein [Sphingobacteriaceae bacterium]